MVNDVHWTRGELKKRSKEMLHLHYWRLVLITFLLAFFIGSGTIVTEVVQPFMEGVKEGYTSAVEEEDIKEEADIVFSEKEDTISAVVFVIVIFIAVIALVLVMCALVLAMSFLVINPLYVGAMRFYIRSFDTKPQYKEMFFGFENNYKNVVKVMLLRDLYTIFWSLLFVVPGIVKAYEYSMIPYLLAENPELNPKEVFAVSKQMMKGHKWNAFVLDLSFLGWQILSALTFGILGIFYVDPYVQLTGAALYRRLKGADRIPENVYYDGMEQETAHGWYKHGWYRTSEGGREDGISDSDSGR